MLGSCVRTCVIGAIVSCCWCEYWRDRGQDIYFQSEVCLVQQRIKESSKVSQACPWASVSQLSVSPLLVCCKYLSSLRRLINAAAPKLSSPVQYQRSRIMIHSQERQREVHRRIKQITKCSIRALRDQPRNGIREHEGKRRVRLRATQTLLWGDIFTMLFYDSSNKWLP